MGTAAPASPTFPPGPSIFPVDLLSHHCLYILITCGPGEFVSADTWEARERLTSLCGAVQIYQPLLAVINLSRQPRIGPASGKRVSENPERSGGKSVRRGGQPEMGRTDSPEVCTRKQKQDGDY